MSKLIWPPATLIYPIPAVLVSCGSETTGFNIITIAWTGTTCSEPPQCSISIRKERHSHQIVSRTKEFVINLTTEKLLKAVDWCGVRSGKTYDKFKEMKLTPLPASEIDAPLIKESPLNIECRVTDIIPLGSHDLFLAKVLAIHVDSALVDPKTHALQLSRSRPICYLHGRYFSLGKNLGKFGFSVKKK